VVDLDPNKISDLDDHCDIKPIRKDKIDYDFRGMGGRKLNKKAIRNMMERKYQVKVNDVELLLFPTWECTVKEKKSKDTRTVVLDGGLGKEISR
jgi:hypothetical protein